MTRQPRRTATLSLVTEAFPRLLVGVETGEVTKGQLVCLAEY